MDISKINAGSISGIGNTKTSRPNNELIDNSVQSFQDIMQTLSDSQIQADDMMNQLAAGDDVDVHDVMIAMEEADMNYRVTMAIRNRLVDAYKEIVHLSI